MKKILNLILVIAFLISPGCAGMRDDCVKHPPAMDEFTWYPYAQCTIPKLYSVAYKYPIAFFDENFDSHTEPNVVFGPYDWTVIVIDHSLGVYRDDTTLVFDVYWNEEEHKYQFTSQKDPTLFYSVSDEDDATICYSDSESQMTTCVSFTHDPDGPHSWIAFFGGIR